MDRTAPSTRASARFQRAFRIQMSVILATVAGLTASHFMLAAGGLSWLATNVLFVAGLALAALLLLASTRYAGRTVKDSFSRLQSSYLGAVEALTGALDAKDRYTGEHTLAVDQLCMATGQVLALSDDQLEALSYGAVFHDIGKIGIPESILNKPGPLTPEERAVMERHTVIGEQILAPLEFLHPVLPIVRHEHERWDGQGYPDGLAGDEIPLGARIIFVCDAFHAMTSDRPYRKAVDRDEAIRRLRAARGTQFDPAVVDAFLVAIEALDHEGAPRRPIPAAA